MNARRDAARAREHHHPALVRAHERAFGRRHRHVERPLRVLAVDEQRSRDAERHLRGADRVLDVAAHLLRRNRGRGDRRKLHAGLAFDPLTAFAELRLRVALIGEPGDERQSGS
jgi:hypothetical protein